MSDATESNGGAAASEGWGRLTVMVAQDDGPHCARLDLRGGLTFESRSRHSPGDAVRRLGLGFRDRFPPPARAAAAQASACLDDWDMQRPPPPPLTNGDFDNTDDDPFEAAVNRYTGSDGAEKAAYREEVVQMLSAAGPPEEWLNTAVMAFAFDEEEGRMADGVAVLADPRVPLDRAVRGSSPIILHVFPEGVYLLCYAMLAKSDGNFSRAIDILEARQSDGESFDSRVAAVRACQDFVGGREPSLPEAYCRRSRRAADKRARGGGEPDGTEP